MKKDESQRLIRVGAAVAVAVATLILVVALLGKSRSLFSSKAILNTSFLNISGLVVGAPVRLAGLDIGIVQSIRFDKDLRHKNVHVVLGVQARYLERIRQDSIAMLSTKGLLGDMLIDISMGSANMPPLSSGAYLKSQESQGLAEMGAAVQRAVAEVKKLVGDADARLRVVLSEDVARDLGRAVHSSADLVEKIEKGDGLLHSLIYNPALSRDTEELMAQARVSATRLGQALSQVDRTLAVLQTGPGPLHALLYDPGGKQMLDDLQGALHQIAQVVGDIRGGNGLLHELVYTDDAGTLLADLAAAGRIVRTLAQDTQQGKGTIGGLLQDPTIYEDLKITLDGVARSRLLKALVRYELRKDARKREADPK